MYRAFLLILSAFFFVACGPVGMLSLVPHGKRGGHKMRYHKNSILVWVAIKKRCRN